MHFLCKLDFVNSRTLFNTNCENQAFSHIVRAAKPLFNACFFGIRILHVLALGKYAESRAFSRVLFCKCWFCREFSVFAIACSKLLRKPVHFCTFFLPQGCVSLFVFSQLSHACFSKTVEIHAISCLFCTFCSRRKFGIVAPAFSKILRKPMCFRSCFGPRGRGLLAAFFGVSMCLLFESASKNRML